MKKKYSTRKALKAARFLHHEFEGNMTALAEAIAAELGCDDIGGPLDDPDHEIWRIAFEFGEVN